MQVRNGTLGLHVVEDGDASAPPVLLLHGITSSHRTWDWLVPELADRFRLLRLDFRGHGRSDRAPDAYTPDGYVSDAVAVLEQVSGPAVVIGHSLGGATTAALTQQRPELLVGALMEDPPLGATSPGGSISLEGNALLDGFRLMRESIPQMQESKIPLDALVDILAAAPDTTGAGTFGEVLHPDGIRTMAAGLLEVDASVLDPVLTGATPAFLDPTVPFGVASVIVTATRRAGRGRRSRGRPALRRPLGRRRGHRRLRRRAPDPRREGVAGDVPRRRHVPPRPPRTGLTTAADCEARDGWFLAEDVNAWSSLSYVVVGAAIVALVVPASLAADVSAALGVLVAG